MSDKQSGSGGIGVFGLLLVTFVIMKLAEIGTVATWSWFWVLSPFWIPFGLWFCVLVVLAVMAVIATALSR